MPTYPNQFEITSYPYSKDGTVTTSDNYADDYHGGAYTEHQFWLSNLTPGQVLTITFQEASLPGEYNWQLDGFNNVSDYTSYVIAGYYAAGSYPGIGPDGSLGTIASQPWSPADQGTVAWTVPVGVTSAVFAVTPLRKDAPGSPASAQYRITFGSAGGGPRCRYHGIG